MDYGQALEYVHSLGRFGIKPGLDRVRAALSEMGDPQVELPVLHVAGTNGKGSTVASATSVLRAAGLRVGTFISPHLSDYCERIAVDGHPIGPEELAAIITGLRPIVDRISEGPLGPMTEFEVSTLAALEHFARSRLDACVLEVGMGGRLDSTNVVDPVVSVIAPVDMDHMDRLGDTLGKIAAEKAGIIKPGRPVVVGPQHAEAATVIQERCKTVWAPGFWSGRDFGAADAEADTSGTYFLLKGIGREYGRVRVNLLGRHQADNAATAVAAAQVFMRERGLALDSEAVLRGLDRVKWPGRFEYFAGPPVVVLDGAHNPHGVDALARTLSDVFPGKKIVFVLGILDNRPVEDMIETLAPLMARGYATAADYPGAAAPARLLAAFHRVGVEATAVEGAWTALEHAIGSSDGESIICACGSLYLIGEIRPHLVRHPAFGDLPVE